MPSHQLEGLRTSVLTRGSPRVTAFPIVVKVTGLPPLFFYRLFVLFGILAFFVAFIFVMPTLAALPARDRVPEVVLAFHSLTIFCYLLALHLVRARPSTITVGRVARSTFAVRMTVVEKIRDPFAIGGGGLLHVFQFTTMDLTRIRVGWRRLLAAWVSLGICLRRYLSIWESFSFSMASSIKRSIRSSQEWVRAVLSDIFLQFSQVLGGILPTSQR